MTRNAEALVIGGGPVGLFAALSLLDRGMSVEILDATGERAVRGYACGLHPETLRIFDRYRLMPTILAAAHRVDRLIIRDGTRPLGLAEFGAIEGAYPYALTLRQFDLEEVLRQELERRGLNIHRHHSVTQLEPRHGFVSVKGHRDSGTPTPGEGPGETLDTIAREANFVIAADGYFSACRRALGVDFATVRPTRAYAICEFNADLRGFERDACITFSGDAVSAFWPLGTELGRFTFQVWEHLDEPLSLDRLRDLIRERAPWFTPNPEQLCWGAVAPFEHRLARRFGKRNIWLAGDAAHSTSPLGFHSMNRGFCEADELSGLIASALFDEVQRFARFEQFERDQQLEWSRLFGLGPQVGEVPWDPSELVPCIPASGEDLDVLLEQLGESASVNAEALH